MKKNRLLLKVFFVWIMGGVLLFPLHSQTTDVSGVLSPVITAASTDTIIYTSVIFTDDQSTGNFDLLFALTNGAVSTWANIPVGMRFRKDIGYVDVRDGAAGYFYTGKVPVAFNTKYRCWIDVDVAEQKYDVYVKVDTMKSPVLVFQNASFRISASELNTWSAVHNPGGDLNRMSVQMVDFVNGIGIYPLEYTNASLQNLSVNTGTLIPAFDPEIYSYHVSLPKGTTSVDVSCLPSFMGASANGQGSVDVSSGNGSSSIVVTADDGVSQKTYNISFSVEGNYALKFPGGSDGNLSHVDISGLNLKTLPATIEFWLKPEGTQTAYAGLFYHRGPTPNAGICYAAGWQGANLMRVDFQNPSGNNGTLTSTVVPDIWHHVAVVLTTSGRTIYLDGTPVLFSQSFTDYDFSTGKLFLGWDNAVANRTFKGLMDEVRVWNTARTAQEIEDNKYVVLNGNETGLVGYWNFNDKSSSATDLTPNAHHGIISGPTYVLSFDASDEDNDGIRTLYDNCPTIYNPDQTDGDGDKSGDVCDDDWDNDGVSNASDNCPVTVNSDQTDVDEDGIGDICDPEIPDDLNFCMYLPGGTDGSLSNIDVSGLNLTSLPYTIEMWVKPQGVQTDNAGLIYHRGTGNAGVQYSSSWQGSGKLRFMSNKGDYGTLTDVITSQEWHHVVVVLTSSSRTIYVDGKAYTENLTNTNYDFSTGKLYIGWDSGAANRAFKGWIDEVRIWNTSLTEEQIRSGKFQPLNGGEAGLLAYWDFDDRNLSGATDVSGHGLTGTIHGGTYALSTVFDPMVCSSASLNQTSREVNRPSVASGVARLDLVTSNKKNPLSLVSLTMNVNGTTRLEDITNVKIYYTGNSEVFSTSKLIAETASIPESGNFSVLCNQLMNEGKNCFWIAYDVSRDAAKGNLLDVECVSFALSDGVVNQVVVPTVSAPEGHLVVNPDIFMPHVKLPIAMVTNLAETPVGGANFVSFQQNAIMTYNGYQYVTYWNNAYRVCIARKKMPLGSWEVIEFTDHTVSAARIGDNHYSISMGICPNDGTIHLSYDQHGDIFRYKYSITGLANQPEQVEWKASSFKAKQDYLIAGQQLVQVTYPRFITKPDGNLLFEYRYGTSGGGNSLIYEYSAASGQWTKTGTYVDGLSTTNNNAYLNGIHYDSNGRLHASWVWRETPDPLTNHDICYVYSDDHGRNWYNHLGVLMGTANTNPIKSTTNGIIVLPLGQNRGLINQESQAVDSKGGIHILQSYLKDEEPNSTNFWNGRSIAYLRHIYKDETGLWKSDHIGDVSANRSEIAVDEGDNLYVVAPNYRIYYASAAEKWKKWIAFDLSESASAINEGLIDRESLLNESVLSFVFAQTGGKVMVPYYLIDKSKPGNGNGLSIRLYNDLVFSELLDQYTDVLDLSSSPASASGDSIGMVCTGVVETYYAEAYKLHLTTSGKAVVYVNDLKVLETGNVETETTFTLDLSILPSHKYKIRIEGKYPVNHAVARLEWESDRQNRTLIPLSALYGTNDGPATGSDDPKAMFREVSCYPNPFHSQTTIVASGQFTYHIYDLNGGLIQSGEANNSCMVGQDLAKGMYLIQVIRKGQINRYFKLIKL